TVIRADVAGRAAGRVSYGSTGVTAPDGTVLGSERPFAEDVIVADLDVVRPANVGLGSGEGRAPGRRRAWMFGAAEIPPAGASPPAAAANCSSAGLSSSPVRSLRTRSHAWPTPTTRP